MKPILDPSFNTNEEEQNVMDGSLLGCWVLFLERETTSKIYEAK